MKNHSIMGYSKSNKPDGAHIFYSFDTTEKYIENALLFIEKGIQEGERVIFIENDRLFPLIQKKIPSTIRLNDSDKIHHINNYDFYYSSGDFHPKSINKYFAAVVSPYVEKNIPIRTWAHVEWGNHQEIARIIEEFETEAQVNVSAKKSISVCAYESDRITPEIKNSLMKSHGYYMTDNNINPTNSHVVQI
ncbi:MEDS domain-containing protein [Peribacillus sp. SCS-155]|uniref:MEDS domain-containing protein n=1 Tax=Peribacillus sedimenti TaxID=3115297 RepID=UPI003905DFBB